MPLPMPTGFIFLIQVLHGILQSFAAERLKNGIIVDRKIEVNSHKYSRTKSRTFWNESIAKVNMNSVHLNIFGMII